MDGVNTGLAGAGVTADRAAGRSGGLGGGVGDGVTGTGAAALEGVVETEPVTNLVGGGVAEVVVGGAAARGGAIEDGAAVADVGGGAGRGSGGEVAVSQVTTHLLEEVEVEVLVGALAESALHGHLVALGVISPVGVDGLVSAGEGERDAIGGKSRLENAELVVDHGVLLIWLATWC